MFYPFIYENDFNELRDFLLSEFDGFVCHRGSRLLTSHRSKDNPFVLEYVIPGLGEEDLEISFSENNKIKIDIKNKKNCFLNGAQTEEIFVANCDLSKTVAELKNGILKLTFVKQEEKTPNKIKINA